MRRFIRLAPFGLLLMAPPARAARDAVFSLEPPQPRDARAIQKELAKLKGVAEVAFDAPKAEIRVRLEDSVSDEDVIAALRKGGIKARLRRPDTAVLSADGSAVGPLEKRRVPGKYTVFDVYAEWCAPCEIVDSYLKKVLEDRPDVAVRKLNLVNFDSPLATELDLDALPHMVIFGPSGTKTEIDGADIAALEESLRKP
jgi:thiol-disulfide isomerase/thioredoxin